MSFSSLSVVPQVQERLFNVNVIINLSFDKSVCLSVCLLIYLIDLSNYLTDRLTNGYNLKMQVFAGLVELTWLFQIRVDINVCIQRHIKNVSNVYETTFLDFLVKNITTKKILPYIIIVIKS